MLPLKLGFAQPVQGIAMLAIAGIGGEISLERRLGAIIFTAQHETIGLIIGIAGVAGQGRQGLRTCSLRRSAERCGRHAVAPGPCQINRLACARVRRQLAKDLRRSTELRGCPRISLRRISRNTSRSRSAQLRGQGEWSGGLYRCRITTLLRAAALRWRRLARASRRWLPACVLRFLETVFRVFLKALQLFFQPSDLELELFDLAGELTYPPFECVDPHIGVFLLWLRSPAGSAPLHLDEWWQ